MVGLACHCGAADAVPTTPEQKEIYHNRVQVKVCLNTGGAYNARAPTQSKRSPHAETKSDCGD
jgi:hypothetical protein